MKHQIASACLLLAGSGMVHAQPSNLQRDHDSIVAMKGEYVVDFAFDETVLLKRVTSARRRCAAVATRW